MEKAAVEGLTKYGNDSVLKYFKGFAIILQGQSFLLIKYFQNIFFEVDLKNNKLFGV